MLNGFSYRLRQVKMKSSRVGDETCYLQASCHPLEDLRGKTSRYFFVFASSALLAVSLVAEEVPVATSTPEHLPTGGDFEALGDGFFCLLHVLKRNNVNLRHDEKQF